MGAWSLGRDVATLEGSGAQAVAAGQPANLAAQQEAEAKLQDFAGKVLQWIPGEVIAFYAAITTIIVKNEEQAIGDTGSIVLTVAGVILAAGFVTLAAFSNTSEKGWFTRRVRIRSVLAAVGFAIWSLAVPGSGWNEIGWIADHPAPTAAIAAVLGLVFSMFATGADKHWGEESRRPRP
ncbi:MAG: hypothetical protein H0X42_08050 [Solirubrobacterales bacterium]|nr:hypothetical protein [Solirubrobacterales bacterium]